MIDSSNSQNKDSIYFICGISGCGKSTIGKMLSEKMSLPFHDGDDFHSQANIDKMASGNPLNDEDRQGWLEAINKFAKEANQGVIIACSALKEKYRTTLSKDIDRNINWIFLDGSFEVIHSRMKSRLDHFMPANLLQSQIDILEIPQYGIKCDINNSIEEITNTILTTFM